MELLYRKCSEKEAEISLNKKGLTHGLEELILNGFNARSEPHKWVTRNPRYAQRYFPKGRKNENYDHIVRYTLVPGTLGALELDKTEGTIKIGPQGAYGLPEELIPWFNRRVLSVDVYLASEFQPSSEQQIANEDAYLRNNDDTISLFAAFHPRMIDDKSFSDKMNMNRMTWMKSSLLWMLWRSAWGKKSNQETIVKINVSEPYIESLYELGRLSKEAPLKYPVLIQRDPDRRIVRRRWKENSSPGDISMFTSGDKTTHFGLRERELGYLVNLSEGKVNDITDIVKLIKESRPEHPTRALYSLLGLEIYLKNVEGFKHLK